MMAGIVEKKLMTPTTPVARRLIEFPDNPISPNTVGA
jgi:hypothetical protein